MEIFLIISLVIIVSFAIAATLFSCLPTKTYSNFEEEKVKGEEDCEKGKKKGSS